MRKKKPTCVKSVDENGRVLQKNEKYGKAHVLSVENQKVNLLKG